MHSVRMKLLLIRTECMACNKNGQIDSLIESLYIHSDLETHTYLTAIYQVNQSYPVAL